MRGQNRQQAKRRELGLGLKPLRLLFREIQDQCLTSFTGKNSTSSESLFLAAAAAEEETSG
jgi:hypothetical protein